MNTTKYFKVAVFPYKTQFISLHFKLSILVNVFDDAPKSFLSFLTVIVPELVLKFSLYILLYFILYLLICIFPLASGAQKVGNGNKHDKYVSEAVRIMTEP